MARGDSEAGDHAIGVPAGPIDQHAELGAADEPMADAVEEEMPLVCTSPPLAPPNAPSSALASGVLVWAKIRGFPWWPAVSTAREADGKHDIRFLAWRDKHAILECAAM